MKKHVIIIVILAIATMLMAATGTIRLTDSSQSAQILRSSNDGLSVSFSIDALQTNEIQSKEGVWTNLKANGFVSTNVVGEPNLPLLRKIISVPLGATVSFRMSDTERRTVNLDQYSVRYPIFPTQESVSKSAELNTLPFVVNREFYNGTKATTHSTIRIEELGMMRGERLFAVDFVPVNYNPNTRNLDVVVSTKVEISFIGADHAATQELKAKTYSPVFESTFASSVWNYTPQRTSFMRYPVSYVIIMPQNYVAPMQPFIDWKTREGFNVIVSTIESLGGNTTNAIKTYMQNLWNSATVENPAPSYLLIVGDVAQVVSTSGTTGTHPTDLPYVRLQGTDFMPELYFGRFSAITAAEVTNQVNKTMMHEQYTMPDDSYLGNAVMIAGVDGNYGPTHANGQINYGTANYFNAAHGINSYTYLYPGSGSSDSQIIQNVSAGAGYVNYTAHGDVTMWADPTFTNANISTLQNTNKSGFIVGNCCLTNKFDSAICFGEAWLRADNKGGIIYIGGTNSTYWDEDYWWGVGAKGNANGSAPAYNANTLGSYDGVFHDHNEAFTNWASTAGGMVLSGNLAVVQGNSSRINYYWEIYSIFGDPSLIPYMGIPVQNALQVPDTMFLGMGSMELQADPYTYVALSMNNVLHGAGLADQDGNLTLSYIPFTEPGTAQLVATRSLRRPVIANISVIPNQGPYVVVSPITVADNNGIPEAGETIGMDLTFSNVGVLNAENLSVTASTTSPWIHFTNETANIANIPADGSINASNVFSATIDASVPDQHVAGFTFVVTDGTNQWSSTRSLTISAPNVMVASTTFTDPNSNGIFESGETITVTLNLTNDGHMNAVGGNMNLVLDNAYASLPSSSFVVPGVSVGGSLPLSFSVVLGNGIPDGTIIPVGIALDMGAQMINHTVIIPIGAVAEGFESGNFTAFPWVNNSTAVWALVTNDVHTGTYAAKSGTISNNGSTTLQLTLNVGMNGDIKFWRKVSSESNYDFLKFYIDGTEVGSWSGTVAWSEVSFPVTAGSRTFKWTYSKDVSMASGSDCAWIDDITFPLSGGGSIAIAYTPATEINFNEVQPNSEVSQDFALRNLGTADLSGMITIPAGFMLSSLGEALPANYSYTIAAGTSQMFTLSYVAGSNPVDFTADLIITTNDPNLPMITIPVHVDAAVSNNDGVNPVVTALSGNYPNPFNPTTAIRFSMKDAGRVKINIFNMKGQLVKSLIDSEVKAGNHQLVWNGKDERGNNVASGLYLYRMETESFSATNKMMLMK